jgi:hypothetical protein
VPGFRRQRLIFLAVILIGVGIGFLAGWFLRARLLNIRSQPTHASDTPSSSDNCEYVRTVMFRPIQGRALEATWDLCRGKYDLREHYVHIGNNGEPPWIRTFGPAGGIESLRPIDLDEDGSTELLVIEGPEGTGDYIRWCVFGSVGNGLDCWKVPDVDAAAKALIKADEDFCCKDWNLHIVGRKIVLAEGIYRKGDGNCCPSRGGIVAELTPKKGEFALTNTYRVTPKEYRRWVWRP